MRLDVRSDLIEARAMYARLGYRERPRFNDHPYVEHWSRNIWPPDTRTNCVHKLAGLPSSGTSLPGRNSAPVGQSRLVAAA